MEFSLYDVAGHTCKDDAYAIETTTTQYNNSEQ